MNYAPRDARCPGCDEPHEPVPGALTNLCPTCSGDASCPACGAPPGMPCSVDCPEAGQPDPDRYRESAYDRFMDRILVQESTAGPRLKTLDDSPLRARAARNQERPLGRTRMGAAR